MVKFTDFSPKGLADINTHLQDKSYIEGYTPSISDVETFKGITSTSDVSKLPHVTRWWKHINSYTDSERSSWTSVSVSSSSSATPVEKKR